MPSAKKIGFTCDRVIRDLLLKEQSIYTKLWNDYIAKVQRTPLAGLESETGFVSCHMLSVIKGALKALEADHNAVVIFLQKRLRHAIQSQGNSTSPMHRCSHHYELRVISTLLSDIEDEIRTRGA